MKNKIEYKNKLIFLLSLIGALTLLYIGSFIFTNERSDIRSASYVWIEERLASRINKIDIKTDSQNIELVKKNNEWFVLLNNIEYPARHLRIEDFINVFTKRDYWPVRASNASTHASFGLDSAQADRITFNDSATILLDVLVGYDNVLGNEISMRKFAQNEVRSGDNRVKTYITSPVSSWFNLKLFPEENGKTWSHNDIQNLTVNNEGQRLVISKSGRTWTVTNTENPDRSNVENYIRTILSAEGDNFAGLLQDFDRDIFTHSSIIVEFGNGNIVTVNFSEPDESGRRLAIVTGRDYVYSIPAWSGGRLFRDAASFEAQ